MTRYPALRQSLGQVWKKREDKRKWKDILAIFIAVVLIFAIFNGFAKSFSIKKYLSKSNWDSKFSFVTILATKPPSVFVFQTDPQKIVSLKLDSERYLVTGNQNQPLVKFSTLLAEKSGEELSKVLSLAFSADIKNYAFFTEEQVLNKENLQTMFKKFASPVTPFLILTGRIDKNIAKTNITRIDMIKLWWQLKSLGINKLEMVDLSDLKEEVVTADNQKVLGIDQTSLHFQISKYLENPDIANKDFKVIIQNASGTGDTTSLASDFATSVGFDISKVEISENISDKTNIVTKKADLYPVRYLARVFNCDIVGSQNVPENTAIIVLGRDFAANYFQ